MQTNNLLVVKANGEAVPYNVQKLEESLLNAGATQKQVNTITQMVEKELHPGITTKKIYRIAFNHLKAFAKKDHIYPPATKYNLKSGLLQLGPTGYAFEEYIMRLFKAQGYTAKAGQYVQGNCLTHEIDVVAHSQTETIMVECKYHRQQGTRSSVQVPLYIHSRFEDIERKWRSSTAENENKKFTGYIITNTQFSTDAQTYGKCVGLKLISWDYPKKGSLRELIIATNLYPITTLTLLTAKQKKQLVANNKVLVTDLINDISVLHQLGLSKTKEKQLEQEVRQLCQC